MLVILNNKCNFLKNEFDEYINRLNSINTSHNLVLCPSSIYLNNLSIENISLGSQDVGINELGQFTGDISSSQLESINVKYCIVGHSERRKNHNETNELINKKIIKLLAHNITPILCVGEEKDENRNIKIKTEITEALKNVDNYERVIIAYEPIWSIGSGNIPNSSEVNEAVSLIKEILPNNKTIYGGSINSNNITDINKNCNIDGYLLGKASLDPEELNKFLKVI